jgi:hypothetical protein
MTRPKVFAVIYLIGSLPLSRQLRQRQCPPSPLLVFPLHAVLYSLHAWGGEPKNSYLTEKDLEQLPFTVPCFLPGTVFN